MIFTAEKARWYLDYNPETGSFFWCVKFCKKNMVGGAAGSISDSGYVLICIDGKDYRAHRLAWLITYGVWPTKQIDHINGDRRDNRISNIREATASQNSGNMKARDPNRKKGTFFMKKEKRWRAAITHVGRQVHLGCFATEDEAHAAYCNAALALRGQFARFQ